MRVEGNRNKSEKLKCVTEDGTYEEREKYEEKDVIREERRHEVRQDKIVIIAWRKLECMERKGSK